MTAPRHRTGGQVPVAACPSPPSDTTTKAPTTRSGPSSYAGQAVGARPTESMRVANARHPAGCRWMWSDQVQVDR